MQPAVQLFRLLRPVFQAQPVRHAVDVLRRSDLRLPVLPAALPVRQSQVEKEGLGLRQSNKLRLLAVNVPQMLQVLFSVAGARPVYQQKPHAAVGIDISGFVPCGCSDRDAEDVLVEGCFRFDCVVLCFSSYFRFHPNCLQFF